MKNIFNLFRGSPDIDDQTIWLSFYLFISKLSISLTLYLYIYLCMYMYNICNLFRGSPDTDDQTIVTPGNFESHIGKHLLCFTVDFKRTVNN